MEIITQLERLTFKVFKVSSFEALVKRMLKLAFWAALLLPLVLVPLYYFFFTIL